MIRHAMIAAMLALPPLKTRHVILVVSDGVRRQEMLAGADSSLLNASRGGVWGDSSTLWNRYWRPSAKERRALLFPFIWGTVATQGQVLAARVTNPYRLSYPGYSEMLTGTPDPRINSNSVGPNPNTTVFEWLNGQSDLRGRVAVWGTWKAFKDIFNVGRSQLPVHAGWDIPYPRATTAGEETLDTLFENTTRLSANTTYDAFMQIAMMHDVERSRPRVLFVGYGETDNWAHMGRYDLVLESAHMVDAFIASLWRRLQAMPEYRGSATLIVTTDHGRGHGPVDWKDHGVPQVGSDEIWIAVMGPDTPALGDRSDETTVTQSQIAATVAALLGHDFRQAIPDAAVPLPILR
jgi:hypothetical protein